MQTLFHYMVTRTQQLVNVCLVTILLLLSQENASPEYTVVVPAIALGETWDGLTVFGILILKNVSRKHFEFHVELFILS